MSFVEAIIAKRDGKALDGEQIERFVRGAATGDLPPEQLAAMLMAVCLRGMDDRETTSLTRAMLHSGETWDLVGARPDVVDKHSTGGVGDTVSLVLAPLLAAVDVPVAMMAGRGLGHSQGTLDKLEAIPGFDCQRDRSATLSLIDRCNAAMIAQSERIAPADRALYALRDVTGTVPSLPLIVASIMSKKLALGAGRLILDVKWGRGAFRTTVGDAVELAAALRDVARGMGVAAEAILTDMNQPLAPALGTACEVRAARAVLAGGGSSTLREVTVHLAGVATALHGTANRVSVADLERPLDDGTALAAWDRIVTAHGGDPDPDRLASPSATRPVTSNRDGWIAGIAADQLGWIAVDLGAGRRTRDEAIDHGAGLEVHARIGDRVETGQPLATVLLGDRRVDVAEAERRLRAAFEIVAEPVEPPKLILGTVEDVRGT